MTVPVLADRRAIYDFLVGLQTDGILSKLDGIKWYFGQADNYLKGLLNPSFDGALTAGTPTFDEFGLVLDGLTYMTTAFNPTTAPSPKFTQNDCSMFAYVEAESGGATADFFGNSRAFIGRDSGGVSGSFAANTFAATYVSGATGAGLMAFSRVNGTQISQYKDGLLLSTVSQASTTPANAAFEIGRGGTAGRLMTGKISIAGWGAALTAGEHGALSNRIATLRSTVGVGVAPAAPNLLGPISNWKQPNDTWTISGTGLVGNNPTSPFFKLILNDSFPLIPAQDLILSFDVIDFVSGAFRFNFKDTATPTAGTIITKGNYSTSQSIPFTLTADCAGVQLQTGPAGFVGTVDNVRLTAA